MTQVRTVKNLPEMFDKECRNCGKPAAGVHKEKGSRWVYLCLTCLSLTFKFLDGMSDQEKVSWVHETFG